MNGKRKILSNLILCILILLITCACAKKEDALKDNTVNEETDIQEYATEFQPVWEGNEFTARLEGFYYRAFYTGKGAYSLIMFFDNKTGEQYPVCSKPECEHNSDECTAYMGFGEFRGGIWYYDGKIYLLKDNKGYVWLYSMDADGGNRECLFEVGDKNYGGSNSYYLYFRDAYVYITCTMTGEDEKTFVRKRSLDGREDELVYENSDTGYRVEMIQWYSERLYFKEYLYEGTYTHNTTSGTHLVSYDYDTGEIKYIELGNFSGYCMSQDERYCFFYRINDGLYKRDMVNGKEKKIYESGEGYNLFTMRCIGKHLLVSDSISIGYAELKVPCSVTVMDMEGNVINEVHGASHLDNVFYGNEEYIFARGLNGTGSMSYMYIPASEIENVKSWTFFEKAINSN